MRGVQALRRLHVCTPLTRPLRGHPLREGEGWLTCVSCQSPSSAWRWRQGSARGKALCCETRDDLIAQRLFTAEEMRAAGDVQKQTIRRIDHNNRRKALAPGSDMIERARIFFWFSFNCGETRLHRARIGERHGELQPKRRRTRIDAGEQEGIGLLRIDGERTPVRRAPGSDQPVRRQTRQNDREPRRVAQMHGHERSIR